MMVPSPVDRFPSSAPSGRRPAGSGAIAAAALALVAGLVAPPTAAAQQTRTITGTVVTAQAAEPLGSAQVRVAGTGFGTVADADGRFSVQAPAGEVVLEVRLIGYKRQEVPVSAGQSEVRIALQRDVLQLEELVVSGRATSVQRRNLANAVATLNEEEVSDVPSASIEQQLYGQMAGVDVQSNSGAPGGGLQVTLRGVTTVIGEHKPLYVVDGVIVSNATIPNGIHTITESSTNPVEGGQQDNSPNRIADLNPNDIESIEVLKGASASAIYGSKASNGVIIITTREGREGDTRYRLRGQGGISKRSNEIGLRRFQSREDAVAAFGARAGELWEPGRFIDHEDLLAGREPLSWELSGSASGSVGETGFYASALAKEDGGVVLNTGYEKQSIRLNLSQSLLDARLSLDLNTNAIHTQTARGFTNNDNTNISYWMTLPFTPSVFDLRQRPDGTFPDNPFTASNVLETATLGENRESVWRWLGSASGEMEVLSTESHRLSFLGRAGIDYFDQENSVLTPPELQFEPNDGLAGTSIAGDAANLNVNLGGNLVWEFTPGEGGVQATTSAGVQYEYQDLDLQRTVGENLVAGQPNVDRATKVSLFVRRERVKDVGFFLQEEVLLGERLFLTGAIRMDQSSNNTDTGELFFYPKAAASYRFPDPVPGVVDELKLRAAFGQSGNRPEYGQKFTELAVGNVDGLGTTTVEGTTADPLEPERQSEIEVGADVTLFDERATLELTGYEKRVENVLWRRGLHPSSGFQTAIFNGGEIRVRGVEAGLRVIPVENDDVQWVARTTFSLNRSEVLDLPVPPFSVQGFGFLFGTFFIQEGGSLTDMWGNTTLSDGTVTTAPLGNSNPEFRMGLASDLRWNDFEFNTVWDWQRGGDIFNLTQLLFDLGQNHPDCDVMVGGGQSLCAQRVAEWPTNTAVYLEDASFLKLRELAVTWNLPENVRRSLFGGIPSASVSVTGRDLLTVTPYTGMDPEVSNFGSQPIGRNIDVAPYPPSRSVWLSVSLGL